MILVVKDNMLPVIQAAHRSQEFAIAITVVNRSYGR
jgi:hypothetical protein